MKLRFFMLCFCTFVLVGCGFHLQGEKQLAPPLHNLFLDTTDPYGYLARNLVESLKMSGVHLALAPENATTVLHLTQEVITQDLLSVSGTQQTRQYILRLTVIFQISDSKGVTIIRPEALSETRVITVQSNQILGSSNEANMYYQQMRRALAFAIMNRIASREIAYRVITALEPKKKLRK